MVQGFCAVYADTKHVILPLWFSSYPFSLQPYLSVPAVQFWLFFILLIYLYTFSITPMAINLYIFIYLILSFSLCIHWDLYFIFFNILCFPKIYLLYLSFSLSFCIPSLSCLFLHPGVRTCISSFSSFILFFTSTQGRIHPEAQQPCFLWPRPPPTLLLRQ